MPALTMYYISDIGCPDCEEVFQESGSTRVRANSAARAALAEHLYLFHGHSRLHASARVLFLPMQSTDEASDPAVEEDLARRQREYQEYDD